MRAKDEEEARQTLVVMFEGDVVRDYAFADTMAAQDAGIPRKAEAGEDAETSKPEQ